MPTLFLPPDMPEGAVRAVEVLGNRTKVELLHLLGQADEGLSMAELATALNTNKVSVRRNLIALEEQGLVTADVPPEQRMYQRTLVHWTINADRVRALGELLTAYALGGTGTASGTESKAEPETEA
ncbi:winged helix-turn-helix domain-containing protein [Litorihabitans aurantiacus]|uniref:HTH arsR-type domain-containing protein n=1 Tax=Litorihabitans aurantiacus TaxID=1930061 RepID=A0AA37XIB9_9MICO|nr:winged helix-turn-helix domain-containing protein [Litorihabitans aurantiacus]GMA33659.1 hypothetical protein GCM10025875_36510 [Litorihabitans aurantiacus]GMA33728.1 hypothetical protein GCM10025875_37200 [Litorihabitans aurantiacus]GMA33791.1 hypothetical protein GCM10025875_37830 [Litorihabitans aurantiacus]